MLVRTLTVSVVLSLSALASAQSIDVTSALRLVEGETHGFDYEYDDGVLVSAQTPATSGAWNETRVADQVDYWGFAVGTATADEQSAVDADALTFDCEATASTAGNHFSADARAGCSFEVHFQLLERVRYSADFFAQSTLGYNTASVTLALEQGPTLLAADGDYGASETTLATGWLAPGDYVLRASTESFAYGTHAQPDAHVSSCVGALHVYHPLDYHMDGDVTRRDRRDFRRAWLIGHPSADFDDNGVVNAADWAAYWAAWLAY
ncbi:MAG: hypothetical protein H6831_05900 [Planctomycetes bacterium]|nr:hypothetical protein [Planctomycetota bacterium]MCB9903924.1 hypothetical protein [Planctomycetota bacterium]